MPNEPPSALHLFGGLRVVRGSEVVDRWPTRHAALLLCRLALSDGRPVSRDSLCEILWPGDIVAISRDRLRQTVYLLRQALNGDVDWLDADRNHLAIDFSKIAVDVREFDVSVRQAKATSDPAEKITLLKRAREAYGGSLVPEFTEDWVRAARDQFENALIEVLRRLAEDTSDLDLALDASKQAATIDPFNEEATIVIVKVLRAQGRGSEAAKIAKEFETRLRSEFGIRPSETWMRAMATESRPAEKETPPTTELVLRNLARPLTAFFGRAEELDILEQELLSEGSGRLVTITGPGGSGKTRLAYQFAQRAAQAGFRTVLVGLQSTDPGEIVNEICSAVEIPEPASPDSLDGLAEELAQRPTMLILDNVEQVVAPIQRIVGDLLQRVPNLRIVTTSRIKLLIYGERELQAAPLDVPKGPESPARLQSYAAVQMIVDRIRAFQPKYEITEQDAPSIAALAQFLEGIPLAIELASARLAILTPVELLSQLEDRLDSLVARGADPAQRHRAMRTALEWSVAELSPELRATFTQLSLFVDGWTFEAAADVCDTPAIEEHLAALMDRSLVQSHSTPSGRRFSMLEIFRAFAREDLAEEVQARFRQRHLAFFVKMADRSFRATRYGERAEGLLKFDADHSNIRLAVETCFLTPERTTAELMELIRALVNYWEALGHLGEACETMQRALDLPSLSDEQKRKIRPHLGYLISISVDRALPSALVDDLKADVLNRDDAIVRIFALGTLATIARNFDRPELAESIIGDLREVIELPEVAHRRPIAILNLANAIAATGRYQEAIEVSERGLVEAIDLGSNKATIWFNINMGDMEQEMGEFDQSKVKLKRGLAIAKAAGDEFGITNAVRGLVQAVCLGSGSDVADEDLVRVLGAEARMRRRTRTWIAIHQKPFYDQTLAALSGKLGEARFQSRLQLGSEMTVDEICAIAESL